jgi:hypothetical protein
MKIDDRRLFLKYALPCIATLVKRGAVSKKYSDNILNAVVKNKSIPRNSEGIFKTAMYSCNKLARKMKKKSIDDDVIRKYFLVEHSRVVDSRFREKRDFDPVMCKTYIGKVVKIGKGHAEVRTILGKFNYRADFTPKVKINDTVVVHNNFIVEKTKKNIEKMFG